MQINVKFIPSSCLVNEAKGKQFYQYTAYWWLFSLAVCRIPWWAQHLFFRSISGTFAPAFPHAHQMCPDRQWEGAHEAFSTSCKEYFNVHSSGVRHELIRLFTPRHNGKVECSYWKDNERFYAMFPIRSISSMTSLSSSKSIIEWIIIISLWDLLDGNSHRLSWMNLWSSV